MSDNEPVEMLAPEVAAAREEVKAIRANPAHPANDPDSPGYQRAHEALSAIYARAFPEGVSRNAVAPPFLPAEDAGQRAVEAGMARAALDTLKARGELDSTDPKQQRAFEAVAAAAADTASALPELGPLPSFWERGAQEEADEALVVRVLGLDPVELRGIINEGHQAARDRAHEAPVDAERAEAAMWELLRGIEGPDVQARVMAMRRDEEAALRAAGGPEFLERVKTWLIATGITNHGRAILGQLRRYEGRG